MVSDLGKEVFMEKVLDVASYLVYCYDKMIHKKIDELKLHNLLYLVQRETLVKEDEPLFKEEFEGWKYEPVCVVVRTKYKKGFFKDKNRNSKAANRLSLNSQEIIDSVVNVYGERASWDLSNLIHSEYSWCHSRIGLVEGENGNRIIKLADIRVDANRIKKV